MLAISFFIFTLLHGRVYAQNNGDLRLKQKNITDSTFTQGRLEIFLNGEWGTVCEDHFSRVDANVACHQLGYDGAIAYGPAFHSPYGKGDENQPIWLDDVGCTDPNGLHILSCPNSGIGVHNCDHFTDIGISCSTRPIIASPVRLNGHVYLSQGRVEVNCGEEWTPVCAQNIDTERANLICRELGYTAAKTFERIPKSNFSSIQLEDLLDCFPGTVGNCECPHYNLCNEELLVECSHDIQFGAVRLVNNSEISENILEMFINGAWRTLCGDSFTELDADAVCNKLGYVRADVVSTILQDDHLSWNKHLDCNLNTEESFNCLASPSSIPCSQNASVIVKCTDEPLAEQPTVEAHTEFSFSMDILIAICLAGSALLCFCCLFMVVCCTHLFCGYYAASKRDRPLLDSNPRAFTFMDVDSKLDNEYELEKVKQQTQFFGMRPMPEPVQCSTPQVPDSSTPDRRPTNSPYPFPQEIERIKLHCSQENLLKEAVPNLSVHSSPAEHSGLEQLAHQLEPPEELVRRESLILEPISEEETSLEISGEEQAFKMDFDEV